MCSKFWWEAYIMFRSFFNWTETDLISRPQQKILKSYLVWGRKVSNREDLSFWDSIPDWGPDKLWSSIYVLDRCLRQEASRPQLNTCASAWRFSYYYYFSPSQSWIMFQLKRSVNQLSVFVVTKNVLPTQTSSQLPASQRQRRSCL